VTHIIFRPLVAAVLLIVAVARLDAGELKEGEELIVEHPQEQFRIPDPELPEVERRAEAGDMEAAMRLASYYSLFLDNSQKRNRQLEIHYYKIAATHGSQAGIQMLISIYSRSTDQFDLSKACHWRRELRRRAALGHIQIQSDAEWYYDLYSEYFVARQSVSSKRYKKLGLRFLECAASLGLKEAQHELTEIYSHNSDLRGRRKGVEPCICGESSSDTERASSAQTTITPQK
jgi:TPR repeat protein